MLLVTMLKTYKWQNWHSGVRSNAISAHRKPRSVTAGVARRVKEVKIRGGPMCDFPRVLSTFWCLRTNGGNPDMRSVPAMEKMQPTSLNKAVVYIVRTFICTLLRENRKNDFPRCFCSSRRNNKRKTINYVFSTASFTLYKGGWREKALIWAGHSFVLQTE